jgi:hypothetical protein
MSARDYYQTRYYCPACHQTGYVHFNENDGWTYLNGNIDCRVEKLDPGILEEDDGQFVCLCGAIMKEWARRHEL